ncbi:transporter substrate-binding domain-containing protein [Thiotrichales bacterium 19S3-7]|nr:transporter substrate-binding domain-containing protein [Thiotrichales bacterium 19S3-7]MCF6802444.1 transporter substrate-binding domain-containing protein [Thiotrichales bacterium 19S3-11]
MLTINHFLTKVGLILTLFLIIPLNSFANDAGQTIKACAEPWPPFDYIEDGNVQGKDVQVNEKLFQQLGVSLKIIIMPWKQCWMLVKSGKVDAAFMVSKKQQRQMDVYYSQTPSNNLNYVWVTNSDINKEKVCQQTVCPNLEKNNWKVGLVTANSYSQNLLNCFKNKASSVLYQPTLASALRKLLLNQTQLMPMVKSIAEYYKLQANIDNLHICQTTLFSKDYYTVFSKKSTFESQKYASIEAVKSAYDQALAREINH